MSGPVMPPAEPPRDREEAPPDHEAAPVDRDMAPPDLESEPPRDDEAAPPDHEPAPVDRDVAPPGLEAEPAREAPPPDRETAQRTHRVRTFFVMTGLATLAFVTGLLLFNYLLMPRFIHGNAEVRVPDLTNLTLDQAEKQVAARNLQISRAGERFDPSVPSGFILSQDPPEGTPVRGRHRIMVVVSLGEEFSSVPALAGESQRAANVMVERVGLESGGVTRTYTEDVGEGLVVDSDPPAETVLPRGASVGLLLSAGVAKTSYVMPDLLGREATGVKRQLEALGFHVVVPGSAATTGPVVFQDPSAGSRITLDATVTLRVMSRVIR